MKIALLTYSTKPRGGVVHTLALAEALARRGEDVTVWTLGRDGDCGFFRPVDPLVRLHVVPFGALPPAGGGRAEESVGQRIQRSIATLGEAFAKLSGDYDIVHAQDCISANAAGRCIRTIHHLDDFATPELAACHERAIVQPLSRVCVSAAVAAEVRRGWGLAAVVIPNGVDAARFIAAGGEEPHARRAREAWRAELGNYVLAVGGIEPRKGTLELLQAYALLRRRRPDVALVLAGGETLFDYTAYRDSCQQRAVELGIGYRLLGTVEHDAMPALMAASSAFCFVSTKEGFGLAALEALAAGVPVVVRDLPVFREVFGDTVAYGKDPASIAAALGRVLAAPSGGSAGQSVRAAGQGLARRYTWDAAAAAHQRLYRSVLSSSLL